MCYLAASNDRLVGTASTLPKEPKDPVEAEPWLEVWKTPVGQSYEGVAGDCGHAGCPGQGCGGEDLPHEEPGHRAQSQDTAKQSRQVSGSQDAVLCTCTVHSTAVYTVQSVVATCASQDWGLVCRTQLAVPSVAREREERRQEQHSRVRRPALVRSIEPAPAPTTCNQPWTLALL